jgi:hypothetical protein
MQKLPHWRHDGCERSVDADRAIKATIWGGDFSALPACVGGSKPERYHVFIFARRLLRLHQRFDCLYYCK